MQGRIARITKLGGIMRHQCLGCGKKFYFQRSMIQHYDMCNLAKVLNEGLTRMVRAMNDLIPSVAQAADACRELGVALEKYPILIKGDEEKLNEKD